MVPILREVPISRGNESAGYFYTTDFNKFIGYKSGQTVVGERSEKEGQGMPRDVGGLKQVAVSGETF